ncbi:hypothetical protein D3C75_902680 [compost metagenome]
MQIHCRFTFCESCVAVIVAFSKNIFLTELRQLKQLFSNFVEAVCESHSTFSTLLEEIIAFNDCREGVERRKGCPGILKGQVKSIFTAVLELLSDGNELIPSGWHGNAGFSEHRFIVNDTTCVRREWKTIQLARTRQVFQHLNISRLDTFSKWITREVFKQTTSG